MLTEEQKEDLVTKEWWPSKAPIYDIEESYLYNAEKGPFFEGEFIERIRKHEDKWEDFLGFKVSSKVGIPAGPLLNAKWIELASNLGYDILCYKTIRSKEHKGHLNPNMIYVDCEEQLIPGQLPEKLIHRETPPLQIDKVAVTNSFGMPSRSQDYLAEDIPKAVQVIKPGQVLIVSVVGTPSGGGFSELVEDFVRVAIQAKEYGAPVIEVNFSCPNVTSAEGEIHTDPEAVKTLTKAIVQAIGTTPLLVKVGIFPSPDVMEKVMIAAAEGGALGFCGINTISMPVLEQNGLPSLGVKRAKSGICGAPIRKAALTFTKTAHEINQKHQLGLTLLATGGALLPEHLQEFFDAGADSAMTATGMLWDPYLAMRYHKKECHEYT